MSDISEPVNFDLDRDFKGRLKRNEPLVGEMLEFALSILREFNFARSGELSTADKLRTAQKLNEYEIYNMTSALIPDFKRGGRKKIGARYGHIKRRLLKNESLTSEQLQLAIEVAGVESAIAQKLKAGQPLDEYELYLMVDVYLVNK